MGKRKFFSNSLAIVSNRLAQSITTFVLFAFIARLLGPYQLGQYTLAFSYYFFFMSLASQGFKTLFTRELSRYPQETPIYLTSGTLLQLFFSLVAYGLLVLVVCALPYKSDTAMVCYILGAAIAPFSLSNITEAIFQAQERMHLIAFSTVPVYILRVLAAIWAMRLDYDINAIAAIMVFSEAAILILQWGLLARTVKLQWRIDWNFIWKTCNAVRVFLAIEGIAVFRERMLTFILSLLGGEVVVGLYGGVIQLMQPFEIISQSIVTSAFPRMSQTVASGQQKQRQLVEGLVEILLGVAFPLIVGLLFVGGNLLVFLYGNASFLEATIALNIVSFGLIASGIIRPLSYSLVANGCERVNLREVIVTTIAGGFASIMLISQYQLLGAALSLLLMQVLACGQYVWATNHRLFSLRPWQISRRPLLLGLLMLAVFAILQKIKLDFLPEAIAAICAYCVFASLLGIHALGKPSAIWAKLSRK
ncbi:polysaccharide biosynthesis protein [Hydrococcus rivularis NIES-593]|uniref:Polysaccharide biosynthesis protein n=1 Tax=Hydrococcus rivularis NIES-593 TaxID=1921803 RepID=A0A1U7HB95_9CYAN|nr:oligosaccharide flippase family protein [Hydrococcus rivularis]OKH20808.1 polysaccharide biosynthesis protein [Hydrococcus rivularis NIES-593]